MNVKKTETMVCCKKGGAKVVVRERNGRELNQVESIRYLGSVICESGGCEKDVQARVSASWMKWKEVSAVMNDRRMPMRLKAKVCRTVVRPVMIYGSECWTLKKKDERRMETKEMKMLRRMLGVTLKDRMRNEDVRRRTTVTSSVVSVIEVNKLRWYGHVLRKSEDEVVRQAWEVPVKGERSRGCQTRRWSDGLRKRLEELGLKE